MWFTTAFIQHTVSKTRQGWHRTAHSASRWQTLRRYTTYSMRRAWLTGHEMAMSAQDFDEARQAGFFEGVVPDNLQASLDELRTFSQEFYKEPVGDGTPRDHYRGFNLSFNQRQAFAAAAVEEGYMVDNHKGLGTTSENQVERFSLKKAPPQINHWRDFYPPKIYHAAEQFNAVAITVLKSTLQRLAISRSLWSKATGRSVDNQGAHYLLFNHYRPEIKTRGLKAHQDWSNITLLAPDRKDKDEPGLEAHINGRWYRIAPTHSTHLVVNFGATLERFTQQLAPHERVKGCVHRVVQQETPRHSAVLFADHALSVPMYALSPDKQHVTVLHENFSQFVEAASKAVYDGLEHAWESDAPTPSLS